jgi:hypothetical protein
MRVGVGRLVLAIASMAVRMMGAHAAADLFAFAFLTSATFNLYRTRELRPAFRALRS